MLRLGGNEDDTRMVIAAAFQKQKSVEDIAALLHIGKRTTARILKKMVDSGELILLRREKRYTLLNNTADHTAELTS